MVGFINQFRASDDRWLYNLYGEKVYDTTPAPQLTYDYALEELAMTRAAEMILKYSHERPAHVLEIENDEVTSYGECLAMGGKSYNAEQTFIGLLEENTTNQGHRSTMMDTDYNAIGVAHIQQGSVNGFLSLDITILE